MLIWRTFLLGVHASMPISRVVGRAIIHADRVTAFLGETRGMGLARKILHLFLVISLTVLPLTSPGAALAYTHGMAPMSHPSTAHCRQGNSVSSADRSPALSTNYSPCDGSGCKGCCPMSGDCTHGCACAPCSGLAPSTYSIRQGRDTPRGYGHDILVYSHMAPPPVPPPIHASHQTAVYQRVTRVLSRHVPQGKTFQERIS